MTGDDLDAVPYDERGVQALVTRYGDTALAFVTTSGIARADAEAILGDAYEALIKSWQQRGSLVAPERLLFITVRQRMANEFRRRGRKPVSLIDSDDGIAATANVLWLTQFAEALTGKVDIENALRDLPVRQRAVLVLRFLYDLEIGIVAALLGCNANSVKYAQKIGIANMRKSRWLTGYAGMEGVH